MIFDPLIPPVAEHLLPIKQKTPSGRDEGVKPTVQGVDQGFQGKAEALLWLAGIRNGVEPIEG